MRPMTPADIAEALGTTVEAMARRNAEACERIAKHIAARGGRDAHGNTTETFRRVAASFRDLPNRYPTR